MPDNSYNSQLNITQINLNHSIRATEQLKINLGIKHSEITCIQEPYYVKNKIIGFSISDNIFSYNHKPRTAIVIHSKAFDIFPLCIERDLIALKLDTKQQELIIINVYIAPDDDINNHLNKIENIILNHNNSQILILGDFNAKNPAWGGTRLDDRGEAITDFLLTNNLFLLNDKNSKPTFASPNGNSWIDLTFTTSNLIRQINSWEVGDEHTESDHNYIYIQLYSEFTETIEKLTKKGEIRLIESIIKEPWFQDSQKGKTTSVEQLTNLINIFYETIEKLTKKLSKIIKPKHKQNIWWTESLNIERKKVRALRRRFQNAPHTMREEYKNKYQEGATRYKQNIKKAKEESWNTFVTEIVKTNIFSLPYKMACNKLKKPIHIPQLLKSDNTTTTSLKESIIYILDSLFKQDNPTTHTELQKSTLEDITLPPDSTDDQPFTEIEVDQIMKKIKPKVTPGPDNLKTDTLKSLYNANKDFFIKIFNDALSLGHFPYQWKATKTILISKKTDPTLPTNYRPICISSVLGSVREINQQVIPLPSQKRLISKKPIRIHA